MAILPDIALAAAHGLPIGPAALCAVSPSRTRVEGIAPWVGRRNLALSELGDKMSWDATGGAVVEDDRGRRYEGVWVSASARDVNSAPLPALAPVGRPPAGMAWDGKCGPRDIKILNPGVFNPLLRAYLCALH